MWPSLYEDVPVLCIDNYYDYHRDFLDRCDSLNTIKEFFKNSCTRFVFYGGAPKLVISQKDSVLDHYLKKHLGFDGELITISTQAADSTIGNIIHCQSTLTRVADFSNSHKQLQIISWAGTPEMWELAQVLEKEYGLTVILPETSQRNELWLQQYLDTKHGFRSIISTVFSQEEKAFPEGFICLSEHEVPHVIRWFLSRDKSCIVKPNKGCLGRGVIAFNTDEYYSIESIETVFKTQKNLFLEEPIIVEEKIKSTNSVSPSIEYYIPPLSQGDPKFTYLVQQLLDQDFCFIGNVLSKNYINELWYPLLLDRGDRLAKRVQELGYVGYMDIDCIVDDHQNLYFVEVNPRRTGGTHYHEIAVYFFGEDYLQKVSLISNSHIHSNQIRSFDRLYSKTLDLLFHPPNKMSGIIITEANLLASHGIVSAASIGNDDEEAAYYLDQFQQRIC